MKYRKYLNVFIFVIVIINWIRMMLGLSNTGLASSGLRSLKYFTVLSNLFEAYASMMWLYKKDEKLKYIASVSLSLTFITVVLFLGPLFGYRIMFIGSNFWFHLIVPIIAVMEVIFLSKYTISKKDNLFALMPMFIYGLFYVGNIFINGVGSWPNINDWYGFFTWGYTGGVVVFVVISLATYFMGYVIKKINNKYDNYINKIH